jgi:hypothetical protein
MRHTTVQENPTRFVFSIETPGSINELHNLYLDFITSIIIAKKPE